MIDMYMYVCMYVCICVYMYVYDFTVSIKGNYKLIHDNNNNDNSMYTHRIDRNAHHGTYFYNSWTRCQIAGFRVGILGEIKKISKRYYRIILDTYAPQWIIAFLEFNAFFEFRKMDPI